MLCNYKDILGIPGKGVHTHMFGIAIVDVVMTFIVSYIISRTYKLSLFYTTVGLFILGIVLHRLFCVRTVVDNLLTI
jgi:hypothetical protein